ncbi:MAG: oligosaccharide flippase family protein [Anaerolineae bacterium]|nr:oligosaccharide flippase family protein [Anaerolineae bacterium]
MFRQLKNLGAQSATYGLGDALTKAIAFLLIPVYTRYLSVADYGILGVASSLTAVLGILYPLGLNAAAMRFYYDAPDETSRRDLLGTMAVAVLAIGLALTLILAATPLGPALFGLAVRDIPFSPYITTLLWTACFANASVIPLVIFRVQERPRRYVTYTVGGFLLTTVAILYFVVGQSAGALGNLRGVMIASGIMMLAYVATTFRHANLTFQRRWLAEGLTYGLPVVPHLLAHWALTLSDRSILNHLVPLDQVGVYTLAYQVSIALSLITQALNTAWMPFFYRLASEPDAERRLARFFTYYLGIAVFAALGLAMLGGDVILIVAAPTFHSAARWVPVITLAHLAQGFYYPAVFALFYRRKTAYLPLITGSAAALNIALNLALIPSWGIAAAAWSKAAAYVVLAVVTFAAGQRVYPIPWEGRRVALMVGLGTGLWAASALLLGPLALWARVAARLALVAAFPLLLWAAGFPTGDERAHVMRLLAGYRR